MFVLPVSAAAGDFRSVKGFADHLNKKQEYARAITEYYRTLFLFPEKDRDGSISLNLALSYAALGDYAKAEEFFEMIHETAKKNGFTLKEIVRTQHAVDHPINFPEGAYLKCLISKCHKK